MVGGNDCLHDSRTDSSSGVLRVDEGKGAAARHFEAGAGGVGQDQVRFVDRTSLLLSIEDREMHMR
jgi:hypothetical protein